MQSCLEDLPRAQNFTPQVPGHKRSSRYAKKNPRAEAPFKFRKATLWRSGVPNTIRKARARKSLIAQELYQRGGMTAMEMICAITCITSMMCFSMGLAYESLFEETVHMHRHRVGARGNATTFLLPWGSILTELQDSCALEHSQKYRVS